MENNREIINFSKHNIPLPIEVKQGKGSDKIVYYGADNLYPNHLLKIFSNSPLHNGIVKSKADFIVGDGAFNKASGEKYNPMVNSVDTLDEFVQKIVFDFIIFGYYSVEVIYNLLGDPIEYIHIPANYIRANRSLTMFHYCDDWFANSGNVMAYDRWIKGKNLDGKSRLFLYKNYTPSINPVYGVPEYDSAKYALEIDLLISEFNLNNITNGFSVSSLITFYGAQLPPEQKKDFQKKIEKAYTGVNGAKFIIDFQSKDGQKADIQNISSNDWANLYQVLKESVQQDILVAHNATIPSLFGIQTEGKLGGSNEYKEGYKSFKEKYITGARNKIEAGLNKLFADSKFETIELRDKSSLVSNEITDATKEKVYTINELRKIDGLEPLADGNKLLSDSKEPVKFSIEQPKAKEEPKPEYHLLSVEDFEKVKDLGLSKGDFEVIEKSEAIENFSHLNQIINQFDDDDAINEYLLKADLDGKSVADIRADIKKELAITVTVGDLGTKIQKLKDSRVLSVIINKGIVEAVPVPKKAPVKPSDAKNAVEVLYSYEGPKDDKNRAFCAKILETDRFYSREEIQTMSSIFGYDIFKFRGGWYHNPQTNEDTPWCRHRWHANKVIRKGASK